MPFPTEQASALALESEGLWARALVYEAWDSGAEFVKWVLSLGSQMAGHDWTSFWEACALAAGRRYRAAGAQAPSSSKLTFFTTGNAYLSDVSKLMRTSIAN